MCGQSKMSVTRELLEGSVGMLNSHFRLKDIQGLISNSDGRHEDMFGIARDSRSKESLSDGLA